MSTNPQSNIDNITRLLLQRELGQEWSATDGCTTTSVRGKIESWSEADLFQHCSAEYAYFNPSPRSTIAVCYNCDGTLLASTHGDHTVKIISCQSGKLVRSLIGHRRTPWVVRFHPKNHHLLASGSLDHEVRLWDASTGQCMSRHTFGKPIASLAFHIDASVLAIACGHKLYMWEYLKAGAVPTIVLKTRRSMRAVHFHPHGMPLVLTAEVQDPSATPDLPPSLATSENGMSYVAEQHGNVVKKRSRDGVEVGVEYGRGRGSIKESLPIPVARHQQQRRQQQQQEGDWDRNRHSTYATHRAMSDIDDVKWNQRMDDQGGTSTASLMPSLSSSSTQHARTRLLPLSMVPFGMEVPFPTPSNAIQLQTSTVRETEATPRATPRVDDALNYEHPMAHLMDMNRRIGGVSGVDALPPPPPLTDDDAARRRRRRNTAQNTVNNNNHNNDDLHAQLATYASMWNILGDQSDQPPRVRLRFWKFDQLKPSTEFDEDCAVQLTVSDAVLCSEMGVHFSPCGRYVVATVACKSSFTSKMVHPQSQQQVEENKQGEEQGEGASHRRESDTDALLRRQSESAPDRNTASAAARTMLEMMMDWTSGAHRGRGNAPAGIDVPATADVHRDGNEEDVDRHTSRRRPTTTTTTQNSQQSLPEHVVFEIRVISLDKTQLGLPLRAKRIRSAHCLTSVQFSPTGDHILLAYGKKHNSLLRSLIIERGALVPLHTVIEVVRVRDMQIASVLPSPEDEINAACFHPMAGGGMAYGTKEGRLRMVTHGKILHQGGRGGERRGSLNGRSGGGEEEGEEGMEVDDMGSAVEMHQLRALHEIFQQQQWLLFGGNPPSAADHDGDNDTAMM